ncbi:MAG: hypothetical protein Q7S47_03015 [bacterium]|nr:hypothetical protein [bacterium]
MFSFSKSKEQKFWDWFSANLERYFNFDYQNLETRAAVEESFDKLSDQLKKVHTHLCFEFGRVGDDGRREFILSVGGIRDALPAVEKLMKACPEGILSQWDIQGFKPRMSLDLCLGFGDVVLNVDMLSFKPFEDRDAKLIGLEIYVAGIEVDDRIKSACFLFLDNALGEYDVATKIGFVEIKPQTELGDEQSIAFRELPDLIDRYFLRKE